MRHYSVYVTYEARKDMNTVHNYIAKDLMSPITASNYRVGILQTIKELATTAGIYAFTQNEFIQSQYGYKSRTVRYKKMTIIYNTIDDRAIVRRIIAGSLIK